MKNSLKAALAVLAAGVFLFTSCASAGRKKGTAAFDEAVGNGDLAGAVEALQAAKPIKNDSIRQRMDIAVMQHFAGDYDSSIKGLTDVDRAMWAAVTKSITKGALAAIANENAAEYAGTVYENHYVNVFNALNYYNKGELENAIAIMRDLVRKQQDFDQITEAAIEDAAADADPADDGPDAGRQSSTSLDAAAMLFNIDLANVRSKLPEKAAPDDQFRFSPTERYVAVMLYSVRSSDSRASQDTRYFAMDEVRRQSRLLGTVNADYDIGADTRVERGMGRLNVLAFSDLIGRREEQDLYYPGDFSVVAVDTMLDVPIIVGSARAIDPKMQYIDIGYISGVPIPPFNIKIAYPVFDEEKARASKAVSRVVISASRTDGGAPMRQELALLEDFNDAVAKDVRIKARKDFKRSMARSITQKAVAVTSATAGLQALGDNFDIPDFLIRQAAKGIGIAFTKIDEKAVTADVRQVITLPGTARAGGMTLEPGTYDVAVSYYQGSHLVDVQHFADVLVRDGAVSFLESSCIR